MAYYGELPWRTAATPTTNRGRAVNCGKDREDLQLIEFSVYTFATQDANLSRDGSLAEIMVGTIHILDSLRSFFAVYVCSNRPVNLKSIPRLDPCTDVHVDGRILLVTTVKDPHTVDKLLAACQTSLDPTEY